MRFALDAVTSFATSLHAALIFWVVFVAGAVFGIALLFRRPRTRVRRLHVIRGEFLDHRTGDEEHVADLSPHVHP